MIDENTNYKVKQIIKIQRTIKLDKAYQFCINCSRVCCRNCEWPKKEHYSRCHHYNNGKCNECPGHCDRYAHCRADSYPVYEEKEEEIILHAKKNAFEEGQKGLSYNNMLLNQTVDEMRKEFELIQNKFQVIKELLKELDEIALNPRVSKNVEELEEMIEYEIIEKNPGYSKRLESLKEMKNIAQLINVIWKTDDINTFFPKFDNFRKELRDESNSDCNIF